MTIETCIERIDKYITKDNMQPCIIDVQNPKDMSAIVTHYNVGNSKFIFASNYCKNDEFIRIETLFDDLSKSTDTVFVIELSSFLKLKGDQYLKDTLKSILAMATKSHVVVITYQCKNQLDFFDPRLKNRIYCIDGDSADVPVIVFSTNKMPLPSSAEKIIGLQNIASIIESGKSNSVYLLTDKRKSSFSFSSVSLSELNNPYVALTKLDSYTDMTSEQLGTEAQWMYALDKFNSNCCWKDIFNNEFGSYQSLNLIVNNYLSFDENKRWLYFIALKMYGCTNNWVLNTAAKRAVSSSDLIKQIFRSILDIQPFDINFQVYYEQRKVLLNQLDNPIDEVNDYCKIVTCKGQNAIYYLTDNTQKEKELIIFLLDKYCFDYGKDNILSALKMVYPDLYSYLSDYHFNSEFLDTYFKEYKFQKVINKLLPQFKSVVEEQAILRDYNKLLPARATVIESIDTTNSMLYFVDAMGVEYLGFILSLCKDFDLMSRITVCTCELPSITSQNKDFIEYFSNKNIPITTIKTLDEIKHHGEGDFDYQKKKLPLYLIAELNAVRELISKINVKLIDGTISKAILISDHGASRLAVINNSDNILTMAENGEHSGRCCLKREIDIQPTAATDMGDYWVLANYDRFKGGRKANVEVHGGATLEEVTVPIIEITRLEEHIEIRIMSADDNNLSFDNIPEITCSFRKKAKIRLYSSTCLDNVSVLIDGHFYQATKENENFYIVEMPDIKKPKLYYVDVFADSRNIATQMPLKIKSEGISSNSKGIL